MLEHWKHSQEKKWQFKGVPIPETQNPSLIVSAVGRKMHIQNKK
jgi:hypothetical protein